MHLPEKIFIILIVLYVGAMIISPGFRDYVGCHLTFNPVACERIYPDVYDSFFREGGGVRND